MRRLRTAVVGLTVAALASALAVPALAADTGGSPRPVVRTADGGVRGTAADGHENFRGIPYAEPPVGPLRWAQPRRARSWSGVRDASRPGNDCPQSAGFLGDKPSTTEDCLYLNVTRPARHTGRPLPVLFFVHGGGFYSGSAALYGADRLATRGDVIVVTTNYRLGVFGFLDHPALGAQAGNYGLADQQAALRWVQRNATTFGGDPRNVTLFGESAGSVSTCAQLSSPAAAGLFQRAVMDSGPCAVTDEWPYQDGGNWYPRPRATAEQEGAAAATALHCTDPARTLSCLRGKSTADLLTVSGGGQGFGPAYGGGGLLPRSPREALTTGRFNRVPVLHGTTRDEHRTFVAAIEAFTGGTPVTEAGYRDEVTGILGADIAPKVLARYPVDRYGSPSEALAAVWTDRAWSCPALTTDRLFDRYVPTRAFEFADEDAPWGTDAGTPSFPTGAFHAAELQYLFEDAQFPGPATAAQRALSDEMIGYWTRFARTGDPNGAAAPTWPRFAGSTVQALAPGRDGTRPVDLAAEHQCRFWQSVES
ncbi:MAG TPA: carboxylesterase family protein [Actinocatenispora sp.]